MNLASVDNVPETDTDLSYREIMAGLDTFQTEETLDETYYVDEEEYSPFSGGDVSL